MNGKDKSSERAGRAPIKIEREVLGQLLELKESGLSWSHLAIRYKQLTGDKINWKTLRDAIVREAPSLLNPLIAVQRARKDMEDT